LIISSGFYLKAQDTTRKVKAEWFGYMGADLRYYPQAPLYNGQQNHYFSAVFKPQFFLKTDDGKHQLNFVGFARLDQYDHKRTHADIRDLYWHFNPGKWEINAGVKTVTWGKTESNHLVDIINQYDLLEDRNLEHKLGQPLIHSAYTTQQGTLELYLTTISRELHFPGEKGRLRPGFNIDYSNTEFERKNGKYIPDVAIRFSKSINSFDFAVSHFLGTGRLPFFKKSDVDVFVPVYEEINQTGIELQWVKGPFALKAEAIYQVSGRRNTEAATVGIEYNSFYKSGPELKWLLEYTCDKRNKEQINGMNNDLFAGMNLNLNDTQGTNFMIASTIDLQYRTNILYLKAEKRLGEFWKIHLLSNQILNPAPEDFYYLIRKDSFLEIGLLYFFEN
jgi:hypothetical protein